MLLYLATSTYIRYDDILYVVPERNVNHDNYIFDKVTLDMFKKKFIYPFNGGQFGFIVSASLEKHFNYICKNELYFDNYFNYLQKVDYSLENYVKLFACRSIIHHFCDISVSYKTKLNHMRNCFLALNKKDA